MSDLPQKRRGKIFLHGNTIIGNGTFIRAHGSYDIDAKANRQFGDGTFVETLSKAERPSNEETRAGDKWHKSPVGVVILSVTATLIAASALGLFVRMRHLIGL